MIEGSDMIEMFFLRFSPYSTDILSLNLLWIIRSVNVPESAILYDYGMEMEVKTN